MLVCLPKLHEERVSREREGERRDGIEKESKNNKWTMGKEQAVYEL